MPTRLGAVQDFSQYATDRNFGTWQLRAASATAYGAFSWRLVGQSSGFHRPAAGLCDPDPPRHRQRGRHAGHRRLQRSATAPAQPIVVIGAGGIEHQVQDTDTLKLAYDFANGWQATYTASLFHQNDNASAADLSARTQAARRSMPATPISTATITTSPPAAFPTMSIDWDQTHLAQAVTLEIRRRMAISPGSSSPAITIISTDNQRVPTTALPGALPPAGRAPSTASTAPAGTRWTPRACGAAGRIMTCRSACIAMPETFAQIKYNVADWIAGAPTSTATDAKGRTATDALWAAGYLDLRAGLQSHLGRTVRGMARL